MTDLDRFVAPWVRRRVAQPPLEPELVHPVAGAVLAADIAGFTALSEQLASRGRDGIEAMQRILNQGFERIVAVIEASGGEVLKFAGDATLAWWPAGAGTLAAAVRGAVRAGLELQTAMPELQRTAGVTLRLRVAIAAGDCWAAITGGEQGRWEAVLGGTPFGQLASGSATGVVELAPAAADLVRDCCSGRPGADGRLIVERLHPRDNAPFAPPSPPQSGDPAALRPFVPRHLAERLASGHGEWLAELRRVSVLFATAVPFPPGGPPAGGPLQDVIRMMQRSVYQTGGSVIQLLIDDRGQLVLVAAWGVPRSSYANDAERAVRAAHDLHARLRAAGRPGAVGVATGTVFAGLRGAPARAEYALIGNVVNRAARLMQSVGDGVWCDADTAQAAAAVTFTEVPQVALKGIGGLAVYSPAARGSRASAVRRELVGRVAERAALRRVLDQVLRDPTRHAVVILEGEAGVGKSALTAAFIEDVRAAGIPAATGSCDPLDAGTAYGALRGMLAELLGLGALDRPAQAARLLALLDGDPRRLELAPLLAPALAVPIPDNETTRAMSGRGRSEATNALLLHLLHQSGRGARVMVLEDVHWMDASSWAVLELARRQCPGWCVLLASRPLAEVALPPGGSGIVADPATIRIALAPLGERDVADLIARHTGASEVPDAVASFVHQKAGGHPLFVLTVVASLADGGVIRRDNGRVTFDLPRLGGFTMPATLHGVLVARIDRLSAPHQLVMKVASVMGRVFATEALASVLPADLRPQDLAADLATIADSGFLEPGDSADEFRFVHAVVRDAAYDLLPLDRRRVLHASAAAWYEQGFPDDARYFGRLAIHWTEARDPERAPRALERAGDHGLRTGAYREARDLLGRLVRLSRTGFGDDGDDPVSAAPAELGRWQRMLGVAEYNLGELASGRVQLEAAAKVLGDPLPANGWRVRWGLAREFARHLLRRQAPPAAGDRDDPSSAEMVRVLQTVGAIYHVSQLPELTLYTIIRGFNLNLRRRPGPELMGSLGGMTYLATLLGRHRPAERYIAQLRAVGAQVDRPLDYAEAMFSVVITALGQGRWEECRADALEIRDIFARLGERRGRMGATAALANLEELAGNLEQSRAWYSELGALAEEAGDRQVAAWASGGLAMVELREGRLPEAITAARKSGEYAEQSGERVSYLSSRGTLAMAYLQSGDRSAAGALVTEAYPILQQQPSYATAHHNLNGYESLAGAALLLWEHAAAAGEDSAGFRRAARLACDLLRRYGRTFPIGRPTAQLWSGLEHWLLGRRGQAGAAWERAIAAAEAAAIPYDLGRAHLELARHRAPGDPERERHAAAAAVVFARLGAVRARAAAESLRSGSPVPSAPAGARPI